MRDSSAWHLKGHCPPPYAPSRRQGSLVRPSCESARWVRLSAVAVVSRGLLGYWARRLPRTFRGGVRYVGVKLRGVGDTSLSPVEWYA